MTMFQSTTNEVKAYRPETTNDDNSVKLCTVTCGSNKSIIIDVRFHKKSDDENEHYSVLISKPVDSTMHCDGLRLAMAAILAHANSTHFVIEISGLEKQALEDTLPSAIESLYHPLGNDEINIKVLSVIDGENCEWTFKVKSQDEDIYPLEEDSHSGPSTIREWLETHAFDTE